MKTLFETAAVSELKLRIAQLMPQSQRQWGKMSVAQMVAHCANAMENAVGDRKPPRILVGRMLGPLFKGVALGEKPMGRNAPTAPDLRVVDERDLARERQRLTALIDRFAAGGPAACTTHPHSFFGPLKAEEWARLMYKHLDHHLRQFSA